MGFNLDALLAGNIPNTAPIKALDKNAINTIDLLGLNVYPIFPSILPIPKPKQTPIIPPIKHKTNASIRNCINISLLFAPNCFSNSYFFSSF